LNTDVGVGAKVKGLLDDDGDDAAGAGHGTDAGAGTGVA